jgi:septal ring factor EnvC (AmiA/AmiB activator)
MRGVLLCAILLFPRPVFSGVGDIDRKIKSHQKELEKLQDQIRDAETEKVKLRRSEDSLSKTLKRLQGEIEQSVKKQVRVNRQIKETENQVKRTGEQVAFYNGEKVKWEESVLADLRHYYTHHFYPERIHSNPLTRVASKSLIQLKFNSMKNAEARKNLATKKEKQLVGYQKNLTVLKKRSEQEIVKRKQSQEEKNQLYQTTQGKRIIAEQETQRLRETSKMLEDLIGKLEKKKQKSLEAQREEEQNKKSFEVRKGSLDWPVQGTIVSQFGRQKHPDLNITIINNGIKLKVARNSAVKAVDRGKVIYAADFRSYGQTVIVDHGGEIYSVYGLLGDILVKEGENIPAGKVVGTSPNESDSQVYFELRNQGKPENPLQWLK